MHFTQPPSMPAARVSVTRVLLQQQLAQPGPRSHLSQCTPSARQDVPQQANSTRTGAQPSQTGKLVMALGTLTLLSLHSELQAAFHTHPFAVLTSVTPFGCSHCSPWSVSFFRAGTLFLCSSAKCQAQC